jgi:hypothetical protein
VKKSDPTKRQTASSRGLTVRQAGNADPRANRSEPTAKSTPIHHERDLGAHQVVPVASPA